MMKKKTIFINVLKIVVILLPWVAITAISVFANTQNKTASNISVGVLISGVVLQTIYLGSILKKDIVYSLNKEIIIEQEILKLAHQKHGLITENELSVMAHIPIKEAREHLENLVKNGSAEMQIIASGNIVYEFKEFII